MHLQSYQIFRFFFSFHPSTNTDSLILFVQQNLALNGRDAVSLRGQGARQKKLTLPSLPSLAFIFIFLFLFPTWLFEVVPRTRRFPFPMPVVFPPRPLLPRRRAVSLPLLRLALDIKRRQNSRGSLIL